MYKFDLVHALILFLMSSGLSAGIYATNGPEACWYVLNDCEANVVVVENEKQLNKILQVISTWVEGLLELLKLITFILSGARSSSSVEGYCPVQGKAESAPRQGLWCEFNFASCPFPANLPCMGIWLAEFKENRQDYCPLYWLQSQWEQFMELGKDIEDSVIEEKIKAQKPEQCALLIYTVSTEEFIYKNM